LDALDFTYTQYIAMMVFGEDKKLSVKAIGKKLFLDSGTVTPILKSFESKGYVPRSRAKEDERILGVEITPKDEELKEQAVNVPKSVAGCVKLGTDESMQLYQLLYKVLGALKEE